MAFNKILDPVFGPLMALPDSLAIIILAILISLLVTVVYKYTTNQNLMKQLKDEIKEFQKELKDLKNNPKKMMEVQSKAMQTNMKYMAQSMRSTLITFIPIILIFGWMSSHYAFEPLRAGQEFSVSVYFQKNPSGTVSINAPEQIAITGDKTKTVSGEKVSWVLSAEENGEYPITVEYNDRKFTKSVLITDKKEYTPQTENFKKEDGIKMISIDYEKNIVLDFLGLKIGWLLAYIVFSIAATLLFRKVMKVY